MALDSSNQFPPKPPLAFDLTEGSPFQIQLKEVYEIGKNITDEQLEIAKFWDCNPYVTHHRGHAMFATKKITPGGTLDWNYIHCNAKGKERFSSNNQCLCQRNHCII